MTRQRSVLHLSLLLIISLCACAGVALQFITTVPRITAGGRTTGAAIIQLCSYFTITTNGIVAVTSTIALFFPATSAGRKCAKPETITAITVYIIVVALVYNLVLRPLTHFEGMSRLADELVHSVVPVLYSMYWLVYATRGSTRWNSAYKWLLYPLLYLVYTFVHGIITGWYPYPFMDVGNIGYTGFWLNSLYLLLLFITLNLALISIDKTIAKRRSKKMITA